MCLLRAKGMTGQWGRALITSSYDHVASRRNQDCNKGISTLI